jgi:XTP/dITP diphosphohydrolase
VRLLFATRNPGKLRELERLVAGLRLEVVSPDDLPAPLPEVEEDGDTFAANAAKKALSAARAAGIHALADDSGLCVDALGGRPGVQSARWSEEAEPGLSGRERDLANNRMLRNQLAAVPAHARGASYRATLVLAAPDGRVLASVEGSCPGTIAEAPRGEGGFGYDPWFLPADGRGRTMAELDPAEKDRLSHRGEAFRRIRPALAALAGQDR